ncbi:[protein ADP-ribosylglutamate] hydrolase [bacterium 3DAC]|nr:[protein ADP-ribosylglutamate] hydrolase [bacterium 3DAC]
MKEEIIPTGNGQIKITYGDITKIKADAIVNAANKYLSHGGGVALAIARAAAGDPELYTRISQEECLKQIGRNYINHGEVVVTPAMNLEKFGIKYVIHTVGPICRGTWDDDKADKLYKAYIGAMKKADELGLKSIAFPLISAGIYGCPKEKSLETFKKAAEDFLKNSKHVKEVIMVLRG